MAERLESAVQNLEAALGQLEQKLKSRLYAEADRYNDICDEFDAMKAEYARIRDVNQQAAARVDALMAMIDNDLVMEDAHGAA